MFERESMVSVGDGRGFIVKAADESESYILTAAHCLPHLPEAASILPWHERVYPALIGPIGEAPTIMAQCLFVDPIADLAVLGPADNQAAWEEAEKWQAFVESRDGLSVASAKPQERVAIPSLSFEPVACDLEAHSSGALWIMEASAPIVGGMSGSPILNSAGHAIGVIVTSAGGPQPSLSSCLPAGLARALLPSP